MPIVMFSKMLQEFLVPEAARRIKEMGFDGVDLTVRPGGHVEPGQVGTGLPEAARAIRDAGLTLPMITTALTTASDPATEATVQAAVHEDIRLLKLGYWLASPGKLTETIDQARRELDGLERLAERYHVTFGLHNHSGRDYVTCEPSIVWMLLRDRDPRRIGAYLDPGHATVEGGDGGWRQAVELLGPKLRMVGVKDFGWIATQASPKTVWKNQNRPLKDGIVPWPELFSHLKAMKFDGPLSLHSEYRGPQSWHDLTTAELIAQTSEDLKFVRTMWSG